MIQHHQNYYWKNGKPYGRHVVDKSSDTSYKIIVDPYYRRFSVEKYKQGKFDKIIYDSQLLDFRHLKPTEQIAWEKEEIQAEDSPIRCLLRNQDDRLILVETHNFDQDRCRTCQMSSIHGIPISTHRMYYTALNDTFNGVVLFDMENRPVMFKKYEVDALTGDFTTLIEENWDMEGVTNGEDPFFKTK